MIHALKESNDEARSAEKGIICSNAFTPHQSPSLKGLRLAGKLKNPPGVSPNSSAAASPRLSSLHLFRFLKKGFTSSPQNKFFYLSKLIFREASKSALSVGAPIAKSDFVIER